MDTNLVAVAPGISGNVGSCKTESISVVTDRPSWFWSNNVTIATNSCTGQVEKYQSWDFEGAAFGAPLLGLFFLVIISIAVSVWIEERARNRRYS